MREVEFVEAERLEVTFIRKSGVPKEESSSLVRIKALLYASSHELIQEQLFILLTESAVEPYRSFSKR